MSTGSGRSGPEPSDGSNARIEELENISSPFGENRAMASSRLSMTDSKSVADAGSSFVRTADSWALIASNELPRSRNSSPGRSSATSSSPRPNRFRPLWITWIGRSIHCDSRVATKVETRSAMSAVDAARVRTVRISLRTADVRTPTRISANGCSPARTCTRTSNRRSEYTALSWSSVPPSTRVVKSSRPATELPSAEINPTARMTRPSGLTIAAESPYRAAGLDAMPEFRMVVRPGSC